MTLNEITIQILDMHGNLDRFVGWFKKATALENRVVINFLIKQVRAMVEEVSNGIADVRGVGDILKTARAPNCDLATEVLVECILYLASVKYIIHQRPGIRFNRLIFNLLIYCIGFR